MSTNPEAIPASQLKLQVSKEGDSATVICTGRLTLGAASNFKTHVKQVVKEWSLSTIYKGMFEFMVLQCIAIAIVMFVPSIATWFPGHLNSQQQAIETEQVDDSMNRLEEDPLKGLQNNEEEEPKK